MRSHLHAELIQAISIVLEHSSHPVNFYKVKAHSVVFGNKGADACACAAALKGTTEVALPEARDPFHDFYWLTLRSSHGRNCDSHHSRTTPTHYFTNLTDKLKNRMHNRHKLGSADTSGFYYNSWKRLNYTIQPTSLNTTVSPEAHKPPFQLANKEISNSFWTNAKITHKHQIHVLKYRTGTVYTQKHAMRFKLSSTSARCPLCNKMDSINHVALRCMHPTMKGMHTDKHHVGLSSCGTSGGGVAGHLAVESRRRRVQESRSMADNPPDPL
eukprot:1161428-Pelagomonas_calceolata.AAC.3